MPRDRDTPAPPPKSPPSTRRGRRLHEDGGETITVHIYINSKLRYKRSATITGNGDENEVRRYVTDTGAVINHRRGLGVLRLARRLLDSLS